METLLESWTPRKPSASLKARVFPAERLTLNGEVAPLWDLPWKLMATTAAAFLMLLVISGSNPSRLSELAGGSLSTLAVTQPDFASYLGNHSPHNNLALNDATFASTSQAPCLSTHASHLGTNTVRP